MIGNAIIAYFHYLGILVLFASLLLEHSLYRAELSVTQARRLTRIDGLYGLSAIVVLISGILRVFNEPKGVDYYLVSQFFYVKVGLFILVGLLSIYPTVHFFKWRNNLRVSQPPQIGTATAQRVISVIRIELLAIALLPLLAALMARGF